MKYFSTEKISEHLYRIVLPGNVCAFLAEGDEKAALIDTGYGIGSLKEYVQDICRKPLTVILTHGHYDHAGGAGEFDEVYVPEKDRELALRHSKKALRLQMLGMPGVPEDDLAGELNSAQIITYEADQRFDLGGLTVRMAALPGHTAGMHCPLFEEERTVLLGDAVNSMTFMQFEESSMISGYLTALVRFQKEYGDMCDRALYSHVHNYGGPEIVEEMISLCRKMLEPGFRGIDMSSAFGEGVLLAKPVNEMFRNADGTTANMAYRTDKLR